MIAMRGQTGKWLALVLVLAVLVRLGMWAAYTPYESNDTPTYLHLARSLANHNGFESYNGTRTPGYPIFLMLCGSITCAYAVQLTLGLLTTLLFFYIGWKVSGRAWLAGFAGLAYALNPALLFYEAALLSEALATFLLALLLAGLLWMFDAVPTRRAGLIALGVGLAGTALAMTRPLFIFVPLWGILFFLFRRNLAWSARIGLAALVIIPVLAVTGVWVNFIHTNFKIWGLDSIGGYHLVNHTTDFFQFAPEEYASVRDVFVSIRDRRVAETGTSINTIWDAIPTLMKITGLNYYALSRLMGKISTGLIRSYPWFYAQKLVIGWFWFWRPAVSWLPENLSWPVLETLVRAVAQAARFALLAVNAIFLAGSLALLWKPIRSRLNMSLFLWMIMGAVWIASALQTVAEHGDNSRFGVPLYPLIILLVIWWSLQALEAWKRESKIS
jgi:4-amino-4-deoxy-L-arabinose transferase-like glycosyltransferase